MTTRRSVRARMAVGLGVIGLVLGTSLPIAQVQVAIAADPSGHRFLGDQTTAPPIGRSAPLAAVAAATTVAGFQDTAVFSGLTHPTALRFSPDGRVFVAEKSGIIKVFDSLTATTPTIFADLRTNVDDYWDRGLLGMTLDPAFPTNPYVYVLYTYDALPGGSAPRWNDACPGLAAGGPGATTDGCVVTGRLSRLTMSGGVSIAETPLITDWCQQYPSHSMGDLRFGSDGALYLTAGDGASFTFADYGQGGGTSGSPTVKNPCGDPPAGAGGTQSPPTARGGALRSQSVRRPAGDPTVLNGALLRVDPATGAAKLDNPLASSSNENARRIVAYGFRNPFRFTIRPNTSDIWIGDVGWNDWEEINRVPDPLASTVANMGWPCYEGNGQQSTYKALGLDVCSSLYASPAGLTAPYFTYNHTANVVAGESCPTGSSSVTGLAFYHGGAYPAAYNGALFFADHSRNCIWAMRAGANGLPNPSQIETFVAGASNPVDLESSPGGDIFYVDFEGGGIHRITFTTTNQAPTAAIVATPPSGPSPLMVALDGTGSTDPEGGVLTYAWDLNNDGLFNDSTAAKPSVTFATSGTHTVRLRVTDPGGMSGTASLDVLVDDSLPRPVIDTPAATLTWKVGDLIPFTGHATDGLGVAIPVSGLSWALILHHCPSNCHTHTIQSWAGTASGSFSAPDHDYPSYLELTLTATDSANRQATSSISLDPRTVDLTFQTIPTGLKLVVGTASEATTPFTRTVIVGSAQESTAASPQTLGGTNYAFSSWSDSGAATHTISAPAVATTYTATFAATGGTTAYLSDLAYTVTASGWGPVEKDRSNGEQLAGDGLPITLAGVVYAKGLGTHAASDIRYTMTACTSFTAKVGVDDEVGNLGSVVFQVWTDGTKIYDSGVLTGASPTATVSVDVTGRTNLQLVVTNGGDNLNYDHADWADAKLTCGGSPPPPDTTPPTVTGTTPVNGATGVAASVNPSATFSEAIDPTTVSATTFTLTNQATTAAVTGTVGYNAPTLTATFSPSAALTAGTTYLARLKGGSAGVKDLAGNPLAADATWTFTVASTTTTTAYLSDLAYTVTASGWGPVEKDRSNGEQLAGDGLPITLAGVVYAKGLGTHAASDIRYTMTACTSFTAKVGVDDEVGNLGSVVFQVWTDGTKIYDSGVLTGASPTATVSVDVTGRTNLQLVVTNGGDNLNYDHADWADAKLTCGI